MDNELEEQLIELVGKDFLSYFNLHCQKWHEKDDNREYNLRMLHGVVTRIKDPECLQTLIKIVCKKGNQCCLLQNTRDGRWTVLNKKIPPPVFVCKLFRWADIHAMSELNQYDYCMCHYKRFSEFICINPFHYSRDVSKPRIHITVRYPYIEPLVGKLIANTNNFWVTIYHYMTCLVNKWAFEGRSNPVFVNASPRCSYNNNEYFSLFCEEFIIKEPKILDKFSKIDKGISIINTENGVFLKSLMTHQVFVKSPLMNRINSFHKDTIIQVKGEETVLIFDFEKFSDLICSISKKATYEEIQSFYEYGKIIVSFFDSWGLHGIVEQFIEHNIYIEIILHRAFKIVDSFAAFTPSLSKISINE